MSFFFYLEYEAILRLQPQIRDGSLDLFFEIHVSFPGNIEGRKQISNQTHEHRLVIRDDFGDVEIAKSSH